MNSLTKSLDVDGYSIIILGCVRCSDEQGHDAFEVLFKDGRKFYGEWQAKWLDDKIHFAVEVISFGYWTAGNITNPSPDATVKFIPEEAITIKNLLIKLFNRRDLTERKSPFSLKGAIFNNHVIFRHNWIKCK